MTTPTKADLLAQAREASDKLRIIPASRLRSAEIRDAGKAVKAYLDAERGELIDQVKGDETVLTALIAALAGDAMADKRHEHDLFTDVEIFSEDFLAERGLWNGAMLEQASDEVLAELGLQRASEPHADDAVSHDLASPGLGDHLHAMERLYGPYSFGAPPLTRQGQPA